MNGIKETVVPLPAEVMRIVLRMVARGTLLERSFEVLVRMCYSRSCSGSFCRELWSFPSPRMV